jgi:hypothetical protein
MTTDTTTAPSVTGDIAPPTGVETGRKKGKPEAKPRSFVNNKKWIALFAPERSWAYVMACVALIAFGFAALEGLTNIVLIHDLNLRQPIIVGETTAKALVPLFPNGAGTTVCDVTCIQGSLQTFIIAFRSISGEMDGVQATQHDNSARAAAFIAKGSPAMTVANQYYQHYPPYALAAKGLKLEVTGIVVDVDHQTPNRYDARWTDVVTDVRTHRILGRHPFGAQLDVIVDPSARSEDLVRYNFGGVFVTDLHLFEVQ